MSWDLARGEEFLPKTSLSELKQLMRAETKAKPRLRLLIAVHRKQGKSIDEIAEACDVPRRTAHGTLERFRERGVEAAHAARKPGRPKRLNAIQLRGLRKRLLRSPQASGFKESFWSTRSVIALVKREYGVAYTPQWMWTLLCQLGFSVKKPRPTHYKSSPRVREAFKKKRGWKSREQNASAEPRFVWMNAVS
jgi:transposase